MEAGRAYRVLDLKSDASPESVKAAYRRLALESHPDKNGGDDRRFKEVSEAYSALKDRKPGGPGEPAKRGPRAPGPWGAPRPKGPAPEEDWGRFTRGVEEEDWWKEYEKKFWRDYEAARKGSSGPETEKAREPDEQPDLSVSVDKSLCIGCCSCEIIAPEVFEIDKNTNLNPKSRVINERGAGVNKIMNAAETCPTKAISVGDRSGRLFPR